MEVAIHFSAVAYVSGDNLAEIKQKWEDTEIFTEDFNIDFDNVDAVVETEDFEEITDEFYAAV